MKKSSCLFIGCGQAGNNILNEILKKDKRYVGLFVNTAIGDMINLETCDLESNAYLIPNANGSGKDRNKAKNYVKKYVNTFAEIVKGYVQQENVFFIYSSDGGTGSGCSPLLIKALNKVCPEKNINIIMILPKTTEQEIALRNSQECWNETIKVFNETGATLTLVDNNSRKDIMEINEILANDIHNSVSIDSKHPRGGIDESDSQKVNMASGYKVVLELDSSIPNIKDSIDNALDKSIYVHPETFECDYLAVSVNENIFNADSITNEFEVYQVSYRGYNTKNKNTLIMNGCTVPTSGINLISQSLSSLIDRRSKRNTQTNVYVPISKDSRNNKPNVVKVNTDLDDLDDLFDDSFFDL